MSNPPERMDGTSHLRASDANRERVAELLGQALSTGQLSHEEYSERLDALYQAKTLGELDVLTRDLQLEHVAPASVAGQGADQGTDTLVGIFGGSVRAGRWRARARIRGFAIFGGIQADMTEAAFDSPVVEVKVFALFGGAEIVPPQGAEVRCEGHGVFGGFDVQGSSEIDPSKPVVVVKGLALFGGVGGKPRKRKSSS